MAETVTLRTEGDRIFLELPRSFAGPLSEVVAYLREHLPGVAVDWTAVREAYVFGRDRPFPVASRDPEDALTEKAKIRFSRDGLAAFLLLFPPKPRGRRLDEEDLRDLPARYGIPSHLMDLAALRRAHLRKAYHEAEIIARGRPAVDGHQAWVRWPRGLPSDPEGFLAALQELEAYPEEILAEVRAGDAVGEYHPPGAGTPGMSARGETLPARPGDDPVQLGSGLRRDAEGGEIVAEVGGHLRLAGAGGSRAEVTALLHTADPQELREQAGVVFPGSLIVEGDLEVGFPLRVLGDVEVRGAVIRSPLEVMGSLFVRDGVIQRGRTPVKVGGLAVAAFLDHASIQARTVLIRRYSLKSQIHAMEALLTPREGSIQGGAVSAGREIRAGAVGSNNAMATEVSVCTPGCADPFRAAYLEWAEALEGAAQDRADADPELRDAAARWREEAEALALPDPSEARLRAQSVFPGVTVRVGTAARPMDNAVGPAEFLFERVGSRGRVALTRG